MNRDAALFGLWVLVLALCMYFGPVARPWFEGAAGVWAAWGMIIIGAAAFIGAGRLWLYLPPKRRFLTAWGLSAVALGFGLLAWLQPLLIERSHLILYGVLGWLSWRLAGNWQQGGRRMLWAMLLAAGVGLLDEVAQGVHPNRMFDLRDVATNALAGALGVISAGLLNSTK